MLIRKATVQDAPAVSRLIVMAEAEMVMHLAGKDDPDKAAEVIQQYVLSPVANRYSLSNCLAAVVDGQTAGMVIAFPADRQPELDTVIIETLRQRRLDIDELFFEGEPGTYYLSTMAVDPAFRGQGIGTDLMSAAEGEGAGLGFAQATLLVSTEKDKARFLYERLGYVKDKKVFIAGHDYWRMSKQLK